MNPFDIVGDLCGFLIIIVGIFLLNAFKDMKISWRNLPSASKGAADAGEETDVSASSRGANGVPNTNYIVDCREIEAHIQRNMTTDCITRTVSCESENEKGHVSDRFHGSSPVHGMA